MGILEVLAQVSHFLKDIKCVCDHTDYCRFPAAQSCRTLADPMQWTVARQAPLSMGLYKQEY